jgi:MerR family copper efflux transcriptional regulator
MRIKDVESLVGITRKNIRFYEKEGLLTPGRNSENSYREYDMDDVGRLKEIKLLRKLDMPISEIRDVLEGRVSLSVAIRKHIVSLDGEIENITKARDMCRLITEDAAGSLDVEAYLEKMEHMEQEGVLFVNIRNRDKRNPYVGPVAACVVIVLAMAALCVLFLSLSRLDPIPIGVLIFFVGILALVAVGTVVALVSRIKEIRRGEENDLSKY